MLHYLQRNEQIIMRDICSLIKLRKIEKEGSISTRNGHSSNPEPHRIPIKRDVKRFRRKLKECIIRFDESNEYLDQKRGSPGRTYNRVVHGIIVKF
jgi:hypothetical protein